MSLNEDAIRWTRWAALIGFLFFDISGAIDSDPPVQRFLQSLKFK